MLIDAIVLLAIVWFVCGLVRELLSQAVELLSLLFARKHDPGNPHQPN